MSNDATEGETGNARTGNGETGNGETGNGETPKAETAVVGHAHARAGLVGNPSDGYGGGCVAAIVRNFTATVRCRESPRIVLLPSREDTPEWAGLEALVRHIELRGYHGGLRLLKAAIRRFHLHCREREIDLDGRNFTLSYSTDIPVRVGLGGSSAIVTAAIRALMAFHGVEIGREILPGIVLAAEREELGISAGLMDRVIQVYEGVVYMDLAAELVERHGRGRYEPLDPAALPPLFLAWHRGLAQGSEVVHGGLRARFEAGDRTVRAAMRRCAELAREARDLLRAGRGREIGPLMDGSFEMRTRACDVGENRDLVEAGRRHGASVNQAGSGGAVVGAYDGDPDRLERIREAYEELGAKLIVPVVREGGPLTG